MKLSVRVGSTLEALGTSGWRRQVAQVDIGAEFPEKIGLMVGPDDSPMAPGEYSVDLARAVQKQNVIVDGKRAGTKRTQEMLVLDVRPRDLVAVKVAAPPRAVGA